MKSIITVLTLFTVTFCTAQTSTSDVWLNEFHYDHVTMRGMGDSSEFIELAIKNTIASNPAELAKYSVILYSAGAPDNATLLLGRGLPYNVSSSWYSEAETVHSLSTFQQCPVAGTAITLLYKKMPILQDLPAAIAIVYNNINVVQLLSYEKVFKVHSAAKGGGPASALTTELIAKPGGAPAMENALTPVNHSVSLLGSGTSYNNFTWDDGPTVTATPCDRNTNGLSTQNFAVALPVRWLGVAARGTRESIYTNWRVATETGVVKYVLEMALVNANFTEAATVAYSRNNNGSYEHTINGVTPGTYKIRIRAVMQGGEVEYSETRVVKIGQGINQFITVYPNPVHNGFTNVQIITAERAAYTIDVIDLNGKSVMQKQTQLLNANTINQVPLYLNTLGAGIYQLRITGGGNKQTLKIIVQ